MNNLPQKSPQQITWLERVGNWNPQLLREIRGKLKLRNLIVAISVSLLFQILILLFFSQRVPSDTCVQQLRGFGCAISWQDWWLEQFRLITWVEPFILFLAGVYSLVADLSLEDYKGTLNFIRISPRASINILLGKLMGVPLIAYIGLGLVIPYHLVAAIGAKTPIAFLLSFYVLLICTAFLLFSIAMLIALLSGWQAKFGTQVSAGALFFALLTFIWITPAFMWWNILTVWSSFSRFLVGGDIASIQAEWWYLSITSNVWTSHIFTISNLAIISFAVWQILQRRFHNPSITLVSKGQSYLLAAYIEMLMLGFCMQSSLRDQGFNGSNPPPSLILLIFVMFANVIVLSSSISALSPHRQALLDWVRFGALSTTEEHPKGWTYVLRDLIWSDKSPAPIAILLNLLITQTPILIWINSWSNRPAADKALIGLISFALSTVLAALITQLTLFLKTRNPSMWGTGAIAGLIFLPLLIMFSLSINPSRYAGWLFLGFPWLMLTDVNPSDVILGFTGQIFVIIALTFQLIYQLQRAKMRET